MTLKTLTGPSTKEALADARRLFGAGVVLLQSSPAAHGQPATVTVGFDAPPPRPPETMRPRPAPPAVPEPVSAPRPRTYGYGAPRKRTPSTVERFSATLETVVREPAARESLALEVAAPEAVAVAVAPERVLAEVAAPEPVAPKPGGPAPSAPAPDAMARLQSRLADVEGLLADLRRAAPAPRPAHPPVVFVGPAGSGKTSLALRLATAPHQVGAATTAALVVAPAHDRFVDPAPLFWAAGVPVAVVRTAQDVADALRQFEGVDRIVVDTPGLPLHPDRARPLVARLGALLAPLGAVEVHLAVDATRAAATLTAATMAATGLRPDALALTRLDEVADPAHAAAAWADALGLDLRWTTAGPEADIAAAAAPPPLPAWGPVPLAAPPPRVPDFRTLVAPPTPTAPADVAVLA